MKKLVAETAEREESSGFGFNLFQKKLSSISHYSTLLLSRRFCIPQVSRCRVDVKRIFLLLSPFLLPCHQEINLTVMPLDFENKKYIVIFCGQPTAN